MGAFVEAGPRPQGLSTAWRFAAREMRAGLKGFYILIACIALGVMAISGVNSVSRAMTGSIAAEGQSILGGDISFQLVHREATAEEAAYFRTLGQVSIAATLRGMARRADTQDQALVEIKAVDDPYPMFGDLIATGGGDAKAKLQFGADGLPGVLVEDALLARLDLAIGAVVTVGTAQVRIVDTLASEPDKLGGGGLGFGPRMLMTIPTLEKTGLIQPGSLIRWHYRLKLDGAVTPARLTQLEERANAAFPQAGWEVRSSGNAAPGLSRQIERFALFLTLVGLTALVVGGVGVANAVRAYLDLKRETIATFKCLGASGGFVFTVYLIQVGLLASIGIGIGLVLGAIIPFVAAYFLADVLPIAAHATIYPIELMLAAVYGLMTALAFALWPLGRAHDVPPTALFRDRSTGERQWPRRRYVVGGLALVGGLAALAIGLAWDPRLAAIYVGAVSVAFVLLRLVSLAIMAIARRAPRLPSTEWRLAIGNIHRPGALTPSVVLSLGLGLALLVALALIDVNLRRTLTAQLPGQAPSFFFIDVPSRDAERFRGFLKDEAQGATINQVAMMRGRITAVKGVRAEDVVAPPNVSWVLNGDRGITVSATLPDNSKLKEGAWWAADHAGPALVSLDDEIATGLGLKIGDEIEVNVLGRTFKAALANTRTVEWQSLGINFVMVFSPNTFRGAPYSSLVTVAWPGGGSAEAEFALLRKVSASFPTITSIRVKDALKAVNDIVGQLATGIRAAAGVALIASILVLAGALAAGQRHRVYDAVILKTLGATRARVISAYALEFALLGLTTAIFGLGAGALSAWFVTGVLMDIGFAFDLTVALTALAAALVATVGFGLLGTWQALGRKAAPVLRNL